MADCCSSYRVCISVSTQMLTKDQFKSNEMRTGLGWGGRGWEGMGGRKGRI